jgi:hypothetical protein
MAPAKKKAPAKKSKASKAAPPAQANDVATPADVTLAATLPATARQADAEVSANIVSLLRNPDLAASIRANASAINEQGAGKVDAMLGKVSAFVTRYEAAERLAVSLERVRASLTSDNADFSRFATAIANVYTKAGKLSAIKGDVALKNFVSNREVQRGLPKKARTLAKKARAKKSAATKSV